MMSLRYMGYWVVWAVWMTGLHGDVSMAMAPLVLPGVTIDLCNPEYADGVLRTSAGGVITAPDLRLQARQIVYSQGNHGTLPHSNVVAEGDVRLEFCGSLFIGRKIEYNFLERTGYLYEGKTALFPWFFGGQIIQLCNDGSYIVHSGFVTTSESTLTDWQIDTTKVALYPDREVTVMGPTFRIFGVPIFWLPGLRANLDTLGNIPLKFTVRLGGRQGSRIGVSYDFLKWGGWRALLRLDCNFKRGLGGGLEVHYRDPQRAARFDSINYWAKDCSIFDTHMHTRYRFQGHYMRCWRGGKTLLDLTYDKLSDQEMATDYNDRGIQLDYARRSHLIVHHLENRWIGNIAVRPRLNYFQTIKQELPTLSLTLHPLLIYPLVAGMSCQASYLDFRYAHGLPHVRDFTAIRCEVQPYVYYPLHWGPVRFTPRLDYVGIFYGNTPLRHSSWLSAAIARCEANVQLGKRYASCYHTVRPYLAYTYITSPSLPPDRHYIFDIEDGWYRVNALRLGVQQHLFTLPQCPHMSLNTYLWAFFDPTRGRPIPRATADWSFTFDGRLENHIEATLDLSHGTLFHLNFRSAWTISDSAAVRLEYRQRSGFDWRKVDRDNFALEFFRTEKALLHSPLSDRRRTLLLHCYWRLRHDFALEWESRFGWDRLYEPPYFEFDISLHTTLAASWKMKLSYQHKERDDRVAISFLQGLAHPNLKASRS